ncbi:MAG: GNAT family N-acetyltransferase [Pseudomonadales bacterium]|nr:GNAT family N-acetyltransferase [Pseudomonadales bacterium]
MDYSKVESSDISRIGEIDRAEIIAVKCVCTATPNYGIELQRLELDSPEQIPDWDTEGVRRRAHWWQREIDAGGALFFAEEDNRLKGLAILGREEAVKSAQMVALFIDKDYRGRGIGKELVRQLESESIHRGIERIYVQSNETASSVGFYQSVGYTIICLMDPSIMWLPMMETSIVLAKKL